MGPEHQIYIRCCFILPSIAVISKPKMGDSDSGIDSLIFSHLGIGIGIKLLRNAGIGTGIKIARNRNQPSLGYSNFYWNRNRNQNQVFLTGWNRNQRFYWNPNQNRDCPGIAHLYSKLKSSRSLDQILRSPNTSCSFKLELRSWVCGLSCPSETLKSNLDIKTTFGLQPKWSL